MNKREAFEKVKHQSDPFTVPNKEEKSPEFDSRSIIPPKN